MRRRGATVTLFIGLLFLGVTAAGAQYTTQGLTLSSTILSPGATVTTAGSGFRPSSPVRLTFSPDPTLLATLGTTASGAFAADVTIPKHAAAGSHTITASGQSLDGSVRELSSQVSIRPGGRATAKSSGGRAVGDVLNWAVVLASVGGVIVVTIAMRRRRASGQTS